MAKGSRKKVARYQKDQSGCMWGLISIFDFRHGRSSQKLLVDKKRGSRRLDGAAYANINFETLTDSCEVCNDNDGSVKCETAASDISKLSVKELMEEEMLGEQDQKIANGEAKLNTTGDGGHVKKNRRWMKNKMSLDLDASGFIAAEDLKAERPSHRKNKSCGSVDLNVIVEELCNRIHQKGTSCQKHGPDGERTIQSTEDPSVIEKKLWESTKVLVNHFTDGNSSSKDGKLQPSKELTDALQILNSHKDLFLKLLQDPSSQLVKHIQSSQDIEVEEGKFKVLTGSDRLQQDIGNAKQQNFWRRFKGLERNSSRKTNTSEDINRIVVLKPGPPSSNNSETASPYSSLPGSPLTKGDKGQFERSYSPFSFSEFKRKLKHAMRKEQHRLSHQPSDDHPTLANQDKKFSGELIGMASPSRDHFFIEKIPKTSVGKKVDKTGKLKDDSALTPEQRVSNIYIEARKHLAEIVGNGDIDAEIPNKKGPRSLGKILAYSGYSSPICSPRTEGGMKLPPNGECQTGDEKSSQIMQTSNASHPAQVKEESQNELCIAVDKPIHEADVSIVETLTTDGLPHERNNDEPTCETEVLTSGVSVLSVRSPDAESPKESDATEISTEQFSPSPIKKSDQEDSSCSTCYDKNLHLTILKEGLSEENEPSSSSNVSPLICKLTENDEDLDTASDATSRPSPVSVLEPLFQEDDISPPGNKYTNEPIRPRQIRFGEEISAPLERVLSCRTCVHEDKYTIEFVKAVVQMSGLSWEELLQRSILSDHLIDPSLLDEVDFLPDLLSCDFNVLFDLINEVLIEICCLNFGCLISLTMPYVQPELKGKDIFTEIWNRVDWYLKLEGPPRTLDQIVEKDLEKPGKWLDLQLDCQCIGIRIQEAILEELVQETILSFDTAGLESESSIIQQAVAKESDINVEV